MSDRYIIVRNWERFQHRDATRARQPTWIKCYLELLAKDEYLELTQAQRGVLHGLWLMYAASKSLGMSENRARSLLSTSAAEARHFQGTLKRLEQAGFIRISASKPARKRASNPASLEKKREEKRTTTLSVSKDDEQRDDERGNGWVDNLSAYTGCRFVRGEHALTAVYDPLGTERPPQNWPHERPKRSEIKKALKERREYA